MRSHCRLKFGMCFAVRESLCRVKRFNVLTFAPSTRSCRHHSSQGGRHRSRPRHPMLPLMHPVVVNGHRWWVFASLELAIDSLPWHMHASQVCLDIMVLLLLSTQGNAALIF